MTLTQKLRFRAALAPIFFAASLSGCVAYLRPVGAWNEPVDLRLAGDSLAGLRLKVECAAADPETEQKTPQDDADCMRLRVALGNTGARILLADVPPDASAPGAPAKKRDDKLPKLIGDAKTERADYRVDYTSFPPSSDHCGKSVLILIFSLGLGPCFEDISSAAELAVTDVAKGTQIKRPLATRVRRILGFPALVMLLVDAGRPVGRKEFRREAGAHLLRYVQNVVYSFAVRDRLEAERPPAKEATL